MDRDVWDANAVLSVSGNPAIKLSVDRLALRNGLGSSLVTITGRGDFKLKVAAAGLEKTVPLADWTGKPVHVVSGTLSSSQTWSGIYRITGGDFTIPAGVTLTLAPGTLVLIDGVASGTEGTDIDVQGSIQSLGTAASPVTFTAFTPGRNWGELHHADAQPSMYRYTEIMQAGRSPKVGHSNSGPAIRVVEILAHVRSCLAHRQRRQDHAGHGRIGADVPRHAVRPLDHGPGDLEDVAALRGRLDHGDACQGRRRRHLHPQPGQGATVHADSQRDRRHGRRRRSTPSARTCVIEDCIVRGCKDKAISVFGGQTTIDRCLVVGNNLAPEDTTNASIVAKSNEGATAVVNIDHTTIVTTRTPGYLDVGMQSHNKYGVKTGKILYYVTNSIVDATSPVHVQSPYVQSDVHISYCDIVGVKWLGTGNIAADPRFVDPRARRLPSGRGVSLHRHRQLRTVALADSGLLRPCEDAYEASMAPRLGRHCADFDTYLVLQLLHVVDHPQGAACAGGKPGGIVRLDRRLLFRNELIEPPDHGVAGAGQDRLSHLAPGVVNPVEACGRRGQIAFRRFDDHSPLEHRQPVNAGGSSGIVEPDQICGGSAHVAGRLDRSHGVARGGSILQPGQRGVEIAEEHDPPDICGVQPWD